MLFAPLDNSIKQNTSKWKNYQADVWLNKNVSYYGSGITLNEAEDPVDLIFKI